MAHDTGKPVPPPAVVAAAEPGSDVTTVRLNLRQGRPSTRAPVFQVVPAGTTLAYGGWTDAGETVNGNPRWYEDRDAPFFRAGGVGPETRQNASGS